ncbi:MAG TPA: gliding motility lipoprotein GldD [Chitinophagales bacterium]|nr:gliding motility lipoprotein GldD [Chitinophagales bacterium]
MNYKLYIPIAYCLLPIAFFISGCSDEYTPKPRGYFRIELPEKSYRQYSSDECPFRFQYPVYAAIERDTMFFDEPAENPCWLNIDFKDLGGKIHLSYKEISEQNSLSKLLEDSHKLTFKHTSKAQYIDETSLKNEHGVSGILYEIGGNAASNAQFFLTDSLRHYIRGSLYFSATPNEDSLAPVIQFVKEDMIRMIESFEWVGREAAGGSSQ